VRDTPMLCAAGHNPASQFWNAASAAEAAGAPHATSQAVPAPARASLNLWMIAQSFMRIFGILETERSCYLVSDK